MQPELKHKILQYIDGYWDKLIRENIEDQQTLIGLPKPYLVPSDGHMFQEMYYWDSFFMALAMPGTKHEHLAFDMTENCAYMLKRFGIIPNASRYYFLSRSQPPVFMNMIWMCYSLLSISNLHAAEQYLREMLPIAEQEHEQVWLGTVQPHHRMIYRGLSRYFDINYLDMLASCESGWDHSTRCDDRLLEHLQIDLNAILFMREQLFSRAWQILKDEEKATSWAERAAVRKQTINELMWDEETGFFYDYDFCKEKFNPLPSLAGFFPLWCELASEEQAQRIVHGWLPRFEQAGGLVTTLDVKDGRQWAYPNGWAPLQWIVVDGLMRYGYYEEARRIMQKWCANCAAVFKNTGEMWEKYNVIEIDRIPEEGLYGSVSGFGWSNSVFVDFIRRLEKFDTADDADLTLSNMEPLAVEADINPSGQSGQSGQTGQSVQPVEA
ncbi:MAG TPA: trehalase family glycosidase [Oculatellaceae cyanobacterium]